MELGDFFDTVSPRERSGATSSDRFHYQKDWALCKILELHLDGTDYLVAFDIHDDVVVFEPELNPTTMSFYQVKTKDPECWTLEKLIYRRKGKDDVKLPSILGKLYDDWILFTAYTKKLAIVSNAHFKLAINGKSAAMLSSDVTPFHALPEKFKAKIKRAIKSEHSLASEPVLDNLLWFERSSVPLNEHAIFAEGKLSNFLYAKDPDGKYKVGVIYRTLIDEIRIRNDRVRTSRRFGEMRTEKCLGRSEFEQILKTVCVNDSSSSVLREVLSTLQTEGVSFADRQKLRRSWQIVETQRSVSNDAIFRRLTAAASKLPIVEQLTLSQTLDESVLALRSQIKNVGLYDDNFLKAVVLMKIHDLL